jgi:hypothetical protein
VRNAKHGGSVLVISSSDSLQLALCGLAAGYALPLYAFCVFFPEPVSSVARIFGPAAAIAMLYRMLTRRCRVFADGTWRIRGFWATLEVDGTDVTAVQRVCYSPLARSFEGHRVYVSATDGHMVRALCISSSLREQDAADRAEALAGMLPQGGSATRLQPKVTGLPPKESHGVWRLSVLRLRRLVQARKSA